ncbi:ABC transporter ATP-binding protein [soil metagenome]
MSDALVRLETLGKEFAQRGQRVTAVEGVNLDILPGEVVSLVGESGSGKTTVGRMIAGLLPPSSGRILYSGADISKLRGAERRAYRLGVQLIHQDPYASLNPAQRGRDILAAPLKRHRLVRTLDELEVRLRKLLRSVDLTPEEETIGKFPHQLSGGQRQRLSIARALSVSPSFLVADEAVSMVDVSIRVSILQTLKRLRDEHGLAILFITHALALARHFAARGRVAVMYLGRIVEVAGADDLVRNPQHPYTQALLAASPPDPLSTKPRPEPIRRQQDNLPDSLSHATGCPFGPRCARFTQGVCDIAVPLLVATTPRHATACTVFTRSQPNPEVRTSSVGPPQGLTLPP